MTKNTKKRTPKGQGWYVFADGTEGWFNGMTATEKRIHERKYGKVIKFPPTYEN